MTLEQGLAGFLTHLGLEKNASDKTVKSYREDLTQALAFARERLRKDSLDPTDWTTRLLRAFVAWLHEKGYAKTTIARRLAAVRSFGKFLCREGVLTANQAQGLRGPRRRYGAGTHSPACTREAGRRSCSYPGQTKPILPSNKVLDLY